MKIMKSLFTVIIIFLLPLSVYGVERYSPIEWKVKYEMTKPNGDIEFVTVSIPNEDLWEIPYLAGKWRCTTNFYNSDAALAKQKYFYSKVSLNCYLKENSQIRIISDIDCDNGYIKDTKENSMRIALFEEGGYFQLVTLFCKL